MKRKEGRPKLWSDASPPEWHLNGYRENMRTAQGRQKLLSISPEGNVFESVFPAYIVQFGSEISYIG